MKAFILSAIILFVANVNGAPRGVDPSGNEATADSFNLESLRLGYGYGRMDVGSASEVFAIDQPSNIAPSPFNDDKVQPVGNGMLAVILAPRFAAPAAPLVDDNMVQPDYPSSDFAGDSVGQLDFAVPVANRNGVRFADLLDPWPIFKHSEEELAANNIQTGRPTREPMPEANKAKKPAKKPSETVIPIVGRYLR